MSEMQKNLVREYNVSVFEQLIQLDQSCSSLVLSSGEISSLEMNFLF